MPGTVRNEAEGASPRPLGRAKKSEADSGGEQGLDAHPTRVSLAPQAHVPYVDSMAIEVVHDYVDRSAGRSARSAPLEVDLRPGSVHRDGLAVTGATGNPDLDPEPPARGDGHLRGGSKPTDHPERRPCNRLSRVRAAFGIGVTARREHEAVKRSESSVYACRLDAVVKVPAAGNRALCQPGIERNVDGCGSRRHMPRPVSHAGDKLRSLCQGRQGLRHHVVGRPGIP